jgi:hypothetical protein
MEYTPKPNHRELAKLSNEELLRLPHELQDQIQLTQEEPAAKRLIGRSELHPPESRPSV